MSVFAERLDKIIRERRYTNGMVAVKSGLSRYSIQRYRRDERKPTSKSLFLIADALDVDPRWLIGMKEENT